MSLRSVQIALLCCLLPVAAIAGRRAVLIGVSDYDNVRDLPFADRDVDRMKDALERYAYVRSDSMVVLKGRPDAARGERPSTWSEIRRAIISLATNVRRGDEVFIYYSGHGSVYSETVDQRKDYAALLPRDAQIGDATTYIAIEKELKEWVGQLKAKGAAVYLILDTCFSGNEGRNVGGTDRDIIVPSFERMDRTNFDLYISASKSDEVARDYTDRESGVFTHYFIDGLARADELQENDKKLSTDEIMEYVGEQVSRQTNNRQHPQLVSGAGRILVDNSIGYVTINSIPQGAEVQIEYAGKPLWPTPLRTPIRNHPVPVGRGYILELSHGDEYDVYRDRTFSVSPGYDNRPPTYRLLEAVGTVIGRVMDPTGARGVQSARVRLLGGTAAPETLTYVDGRFEMVAKVGDYASVFVVPPADQPFGEREVPLPITVRRGERMEIEPIKLDIPRFSLNISTDRAGAKVYIDGREIGAVESAGTPIVIGDLDPGTHDIRITHPRTREWSKRIEIRRDRPLESIQASLEVLYGGLMVRADEDGASVLIDGVRVGTTPYTDSRVEIGERDLSIQGRYDPPFTQRIKIETGRTLRLTDIALSKPGRVTLTIEGARGTPVRINGRSVGVLPDVPPRLVDRGSSLTVESNPSGFGHFEKRIEIPDDAPATMSVRIVLDPKTRGSATMRSALLPGLGQFYSERPMTGAFWMVAAIGCAGVLGYTASDFVSKNDQYTTDKNAYETYSGSSAQEKTRRWDVANASWEARESAVSKTNLVGIGLAAVWALNMVDAAVRFPSFNETMARRASRVDVVPNLVTRPTVSCVIHF